MKRVFITNTILDKYKDCIKVFAIYLGKRYKYHEDRDKHFDGYLTNFITEYNKIDFSKLDSISIPDYKSHLLGYLISRSFTMRRYELSSLLYDLINIIGIIEEVQIFYLDHLFQKDSLLEYGFEDISYREYVKYLKEMYNYSDEEIDGFIIVVNKSK
jgi:hypothetical protein